MLLLDIVDVPLLIMNIVDVPLTVVDVPLLWHDAIYLTSLVELLVSLLCDYLYWALAHGCLFDPQIRATARRTNHELGRHG